MPTSPMRQTPSSSTSRSKEERRPRSRRASSRNASRRAAPLVAQHAQEVPFGVELRGIAEIDHDVARDAVNAHAGPRAPSLSPGSATCRSSAIMRSSFSRTALKETSLRRLRMSRAERGVPGALDRIDLHEDRIVRLTFAHQRRDRRIAGIAAVPIVLAVDLDGLEHGRQAGRGEQHVGRDLAVAEHAAVAGADIGGGDEQLDRRSREPLEIDRLGQDVAQRIGAARVQVVGREQARHHVHRDEDRRMVERPAAEQHVERAAPERAEARRLARRVRQKASSAARAPSAPPSA